MDALARLSLRNRALTALLTIFIIIAGLWSTGTLKQELFPSLQLPIIGVITTVPGANAEVMEERVTKEMESAVLSLGGVESVTSTSQNSASIVMVELTYGQDIAKAQTEAQRAVLNVRDLPEDAETQVIAGSIDDFPIIQFSVSGDYDEYELLDKVDKLVVPEISDIAGVREVQVSGVDAQQVLIDVDPARLAESGVDPGDIADVLENNGIEIPAGTVDSDNGDLSVQVGEQIATLDELRQLPLPVEGATPVTLDSVAEVTLEEPANTGYTRTNGAPSLSVSIVKTPDGNTVEISRALQDLIPELEDDISGNIAIVVDSAPFIEDSVADLAEEGLMGLGMAVLVVFVFLLSLRMTIVTAVSIPLSLLIAMLGLRVGGFTLNILTLGALTISVGRVVDDSIVVIENIQRHLALGEAKRVAIPRAVKEVAGAITSATLITVAVFLPLVLVGDIVGELFRPFALTVTMAILASLFVALTIVPVLAFWFMKSPPGVTPQHAETNREPTTRLQRLYLPGLIWSLKHKAITSLIGVALLAASIWGATFLKTDFIGSTGGDTLTISQELPVGTPLEETNEAALTLEDEIASIEDVTSYQVVVGGSGLMAFVGGGTNSATFNVTLAEDADSGNVTEDLQSFADDHPELGTVSVGDASGAGLTSDAEIQITAPDAETLREATDTVLEEVAELDDVRDVTDDLTALVPTVVVDIDREAAASLGLNETAVAGLVAVALQGQNLGEVTFEGLGHDVVLRMAEAPASIEQLRELAIPGEVQLSDVAEVEEVDKPASLTRVDGQRSATVSATPTTDDLGALTTQLQQIVDTVDLPTGVNAQIAGVSADQEEAFAQLALAIVVAIAITYALMVATFKSLLQPLILLVSVPFAATGAFGMLLLTDTPLGLPAIIGLLMLVGIVVTNAIVLIDLINQYRARGMAIRVAVIEGARHRLRPIVMTALATILALVPMALAITGGGAFISQPLALVTIGGLVSSTLLTLILVPVLYTAVESLRAGRQRRLAKSESLAVPS